MSVSSSKLRAALHPLACGPAARFARTLLPGGQYLQRPAAQRSLRGGDERGPAQRNSIRRKLLAASRNDDGGPGASPRMTEPSLDGGAARTGLGRFKVALVASGGVLYAFLQDGSDIYVLTPC